MLKKLCLVLSSVAMLTISSHAGASYTEDAQPHPYIGADIEHRSLRFEDHFGDNLFERNANQYNVWAALRFFKYFGLGIGFDSTSHRQRDTVINEGEYYLGLLLAPGDGIEGHLTQTKISGTHVELIGFLPVCPRYSIDLFATVGMASNHLKLTDFFVAQDNILLDSPIMRSYDERKTVARASLGAQMILYRNLGMRAQAIFENNGKFDGLKPIQVPDATTNVNLRNSFIYSFGLYLTC